MAAAVGAVVMVATTRWLRTRNGIFFIRMLPMAISGGEGEGRVGAEHAVEGRVTGRAQSGPGLQ